MGWGASSLSNCWMLAAASGCVTAAGCLVASPEPEDVAPGLYLSYQIWTHSISFLSKSGEYGDGKNKILPPWSPAINCAEMHLRGPAVARVIYPSVRKS